MFGSRRDIFGNVWTSSEIFGNSGIMDTKNLTHLTWEKLGGIKNHLKLYLKRDVSGYKNNQRRKQRSKLIILLSPIRSL